MKDKSSKYWLQNNVYLVGAKRDNSNGVVYVAFRELYLPLLGIQA